MSNVELLKKINEHLEFLMDCTIEPSDVRSSTKQLMNEIKSTICNSKSNGDRIRQMSDEELADILELRDCFAKNGEFRCPLFDEKEKECNCKEGLLMWLKQEVSDNE